MHYLGTVEAATTFKIVSNMIGMANLAVLAEGYALSRRCGVGDDAFVDALRDTGAWSSPADLRMPPMITGDFDTRFAVDLAMKDVRLAVEVAARRGLPVPLGAAGPLPTCSGAQPRLGQRRR
ncbi:MAG: NAD-binding protein [Dermatophilaceae bacterium]